MTTLFVPEKLKSIVDAWLAKSDRTEEHGGTFFGSDHELKSFLPGVNTSSSPRGSYQRSSNWDQQVDLFSKMIGYPPVAEMHTHPDGSVPSEGDKKYIANINHKIPYEIIIADMGTEFRWFCVDKELRHVLIYTRDTELESACLLLAGSCGLMDLGRVFVTPDGKILCENDKGKKFLYFDSDAYRVWLEVNGKKSWEWTKKQVSEKTGISISKVSKVLEQIGVKK
jgi:proteasome lid subunit RPN8/RPN11